jgi:hypothetical protein
LPLDKGLPKHEIKVIEKGHQGHTQRGKSQDTATGDNVGVKGHVFVVLTKDQTPRIAFSIGLDTHGKDITLDMQGVCEIADTRVPFNASALDVFRAKVDAFLMMNENNKNRKSTASSQQVQAAKKAKDQLKALGDLVGELNQKASIPFRIYVAAGQAGDEAAPKVVLFESGQVESPKPGAKKSGNNNLRQKGRTASDDDLK